MKAYTPRYADVLRLLSPRFHEHVDGDGGWYYRWLALAVRATQPKEVLELGNYTGTSTLMMYSELPADSKLITVDIRKDQAYIPPEVYADPRFRSVIGDDGDLRIYGDNPPTDVDFLFIDTDPHTYARVTQEWELYRKVLVDGALVVLDDVRCEDMPKLWDNLPYVKLDLTGLCHVSGFGAFEYRAN